MKKIDINKSMEGKTVFLVPTGNNINRRVGKDVFEQVVEAKIVKAARVNVTFQIAGVCGPKVYRQQNKDLNLIVSTGDCNAGYNVFLTKEDVVDERIRVGVLRKIRDAHLDMNAAQAKAIAEIMCWEL